MDEQEQRGSGDFQTNEIYGDAAPASYGNSTYEADQGQLEQQPAEYQQNEYADEAVEVDDPDANNPFAGNNGAAEPQPPPYAQDPPAAYADPIQQAQPVDEYGGNGTTQQEPEDVVAQMAAQNQPADDEPDYGMPHPETADTASDASGEGLFGNHWIRTVFMASALLIASFFAFFLWFNNPFADTTLEDDFSAGYGLSAAGAFFIFFGSIGALVVAVMQKMGRPIPFEQFVIWAVVGLYVGGGVFYFIGGCAVAASWNGVEGIDLSYLAGIFFAEETFVGAHAVLAGLDLLKPDFLNRKKWRVLIYNAAFLFLAGVGFFAYAVTSTTVDDAGGDNAGPALAALFYFVAVIPEVLFLLIFLVPKLSALNKPIVMMGLSGVYAGSCVMLLIAYFILAGDFTLGGGDSGGGAYFVGVGFFVLLCGALISFDMFFEKFVPGFKDGGDSGSDQQASGGMPTGANEPDTP